MLIDIILCALLTYSCGFTIVSSCKPFLQALNFVLEGAQQFSPVPSMREIVNLYWNFAECTTAYAQGTTAIAVGGRGYFEACPWCYDKFELPCVII